MFDDAKWKALNDNWRAKQELAAAQRVTQAPVNPKKKKGFLEDMVSTGGGIAGSLGGAAAGAAIGSAVPVVGTAIGGLIGAVLGGGLGSAGGEIVENVSAGEDWDKNVLSEGAFGAATSLPFGAGFKLLKAGAQGVRGAAGREVAKDLVQQAGLQTIGRGTVNKLATTGQLDDSARAAFEKIGTMPSLSQKAAVKASDTADDLAVKQFRLTPTQLTNFKGKFGEDAGQTVRRYGFSNAEDIVSKGIEPLQAQFDTTVQGIGKIPSSTIKNNFDTEIKKLVSSAATDNQAIGNTLKEESDALIKRFGNEIDSSELNTIRKEFDSLVNYTQSVANPNRYGVNKRVADVLRKSLQEADPTGGLKDTGRELSKLRQLSDITTKQENLGRGSFPLSLPGLLGAVTGSIPGGLPGAAAGLVATNAINSPVGRRAMMNATEKTISGLSSKQKTRQVGQSLKGASTRYGLLGSINNLNNQVSSDLNNIADTAPISSTTTTPMTSNITQSYDENANVSSPFGVSQEEIGQAMVRAMYSGDKEAFSQLKQMYDITEKAASANNPKSKAMGVEAVKNMNNASAGMSAINDLEAMINQDSGVISRASLPDIAPLNGLLGTSQYRAAIKDAQDTLSRLRSGASMTEQESQRFDQMLPRLGDDPETIQYKINRFREYYNSFINNPATAQPTQNIPVGM